MRMATSLVPAVASVTLHQRYGVPSRETCHTAAVWDPMRTGPHVSLPTVTTMSPASSSVVPKLRP